MESRFFMGINFPKFMGKKNSYGNFYGNFLPEKTFIHATNIIAVVLLLRP